MAGEVTTYLHGDGLLTLRMARLPEGQGLPGADANQIWFWLRPRQVRLRPVASTLWRWRLASVLYHKRGSPACLAVRKRFSMSVIKWHAL